MYASFSRIDLMLAGDSLLSCSLGVEILPRGISDHAPVLLKLDVGLPSGPALWWLSGYWVTDERVAPEVTVELGAFWERNLGTAEPPILWDAYKAYVRGQYQGLIAKARKDSRLALEAAEGRALKLESIYMQGGDEATYANLRSVHREISLLRTEASRKISLSQTQ